MKKLIIFDLDGVLLDSRELHYEALNEAIIKRSSKLYAINPEEHLSTYDGLPTRRKLELLSEKKDLPRKLHDAIYQEKQRITIDKLNNLGRDYKLQQYFRRLRSEGIKIAVCSNSIRDTVVTVLCKLGLMELVDYFVTNEDVKHGKPFPAIYWQAMEYFSAYPSDTVIFEDSPVGREGAKNSGALLVPVDSREKFTEDKISLAIKMLKNSNKQSVPFSLDGLTVVVPMSGAGSRFAQAGYKNVKPLIDVRGAPMIQRVVENLNVSAKFVFIVQESHFREYNLETVLNLICPGCEIVQTNGLTEGAACSVLLAEKFIDSENPILIANSDQIITWNSSEVLAHLFQTGIDAGIVTFNATDSKWSFARLGDNGLVAEVAEKNPISDLATVGIYSWSKGSDFVKYAKSMISKNIRVRNEFYVAPVFNEAILDGKKIRTKSIEKMNGIGTPEDLELFLKEYAANH